MWNVFCTNHSTNARAPHMQSSSTVVLHVLQRVLGPSYKATTVEHGLHRSAHRVDGFRQLIKNYNVTCRKNVNRAIV